MLAGCSDKKPYVPFEISAAASAPPSTTLPPGSAEIPSAGPAYQVVGGTAPAGDGRSFSVGSRTVQAKSGRLFRRGLVIAGEGSVTGKENLLAWTEARDGSKGELVVFNGAEPDAPESTLAKLPKELDIGECSHDTKLLRIGNGVVVAVVSADCGASAGKEQWIGVARLDASADARKPAEGRLEVRSKEPIEMDIAAIDRDHDALEDVVLTAHPIADQASDRLSANLVLLDRPAGYAWDPAEPEASLGKLGQSLLARAVAKKPDAGARAESALRFVRALCSDLGAGGGKAGARVTTTAGAPRCQESRVIGDAVHAVAFAAVNAGDIPRAVMASELVSNLKFDFGRVPQIENLFAKKLKKVEAVATRRPLARPSTRSGELAPLSFDQDGALFVLGDDAVVRVDLTTGDETPSDVPPWSRAVSWGASDATIEIASASTRCSPGGVFVQAQARGTTYDVELTSLSSLIPASARKDKCEKGKARLSPLLVDNAGSVFAYGGEIHRASFGDSGVSVERASMPQPSEAASPTGASRSADGKAAVLTLQKSLLLFKDGKIERWRGPDIHDLGRCVVRSAGDRVACESKDSVVVFAPK